MAKAPRISWYVGPQALQRQSSLGCHTSPTKKSLVQCQPWKFTLMEALARRQNNKFASSFGCKKRHKRQKKAKFAIKTWLCWILLQQKRVVSKIFPNWAFPPPFHPPSRHMSTPGTPGASGTFENRGAGGRPGGGVEGWWWDQLDALEVF